MPRGDRTGPQGLGPMTGRGAGYCAGYGQPGYTNPAGGFGYGGGGRGCGGRGWQHWFHATGLTGWQRAAVGWSGAFPPGTVPTPVEPVPREQQLTRLKNQLQSLTDSMEIIKQRIAELEKPDEKS